MRHTLALCIPAWNAEKTLPALLRSAQAQTRAFDQIWVHDDASTDRTAEVARDHGAQVVVSRVNRGCSLGKDLLLRECDTRFVHFHDADDVLLPDFVERAISWMQADVADIVLFGFEYRDGNSGKLLSTRIFDDAELADDPVDYCIRHTIPPFCGVYRREALLMHDGYRIPDSQLYNEDQAFHCRMARAGLAFRADPAVTVINYRSAGSMSVANGAACVAAQYAVMEEAARCDESRHHRAIARRLWRIAAAAASFSDWTTAGDAAQLARRLSPETPADGHPAYRWLARRAPRVAVRVRESVIRLLGKRR